MSEIIIDKNAKNITFTNNGIGFSQFGVANEILDLIENQAKEIERLNKGLDELEELCKNKYYEKNTTDIDSIAIAGNLYVFMYKKIKELRGEK